ncbi:hypothetical protein [Phaeobacter inhibens]|uniref:hypothetical protein n=1 Tax=Phaeobacter inhibens TaxID=221822 RepID=UPI000C9B97A2|nr:hypothetical protein [Phaeobacter inhibens]AUQ55169.1 hypothetical protein PhaeoP92_02515 [Phaeobacter inhibens]AUQ79185.1 hypothetical protein PhaeoP74_02516 [Phaeobacter inhibens]AUR16344.1 hypothetical protein PhaeoP70_02514 [Phaeobacter inhibens]
MPKERVCANSETVSADIQPISEHENKSVNGKALCADIVLAEEMERVSELRDRQAQFLATLPVEPQDAIDASFQILNPGMDDYIEGFEEALHLSHALAALIEKGDLEHDTREQDAAVFVSQQIARYLGQTRTRLDRLGYILRNPRRVEREERQSS